MSQEFEFDIDPKDAASAIFMGRNHRALVSAAVRAKRSRGITQQQIADKIGVHKSVISRALKGYNNLTERTLAEICWALDVEPHLTLTDIGSHSANELTGNETSTSFSPNSRVSADIGGTNNTATSYVNNLRIISNVE